MQLSRGQLVSLRLYRVFIWGFVAGLIATVWYLAVKMQKAQMTEHENMVLGLLAIGAGLCLACAAISLFLNLKLIAKIVRSRLHFRRLGFSDASEALWKAHQKTRRWSAIVDKIAVGLSVFFLVIAIILFITLQWPWALATLGTSALFLMFYVLQNGKARMDMMAARLAEVSKLKESMLSVASKSGEAGAPIVLSNEAVQQYARIETEQIARSRAQAINESVAAKKREYSILSSQAMRQTKAGLGPDERLKVEEALDALMREPRPATAENDTAAGLWRLRVAGTSLELVYRVDDSSLQLKVLGLQQSPVGSASHA
jgi:ABC-type multidrug transport system fused ATPase/permease subunit